MSEPIESKQKFQCTKETFMAILLRIGIAIFQFWGFFKMYYKVQNTQGIDFGLGFVILIIFELGLYTGKKMPNSMIATLNELLQNHNEVKEIVSETASIVKSMTPLPTEAVDGGMTRRVMEFEGREFPVSVPRSQVPNLPLH